MIGSPGFSEHPAPATSRRVRGWTVGTFALLMLISLIPATVWPLIAVIAIVEIMLLTLAEVSWRWLFRRLRFAMPLLLGIAIAVMLGSRGEHRIELGIAIVLRGLAAILAVIGITRIVSFPELIREAERWPAAGFFSRLLWMMYRFLFVFREELTRMQLARASRTFHLSKGHEFLSTGRLLGALVVRGLTRAERVHAAMLSRGWREDASVP